MEKISLKTEGATKDILRQNIDKIKELFPDAIAESSDAQKQRWVVDFSKLRELLGDYVEKESERYCFTWNGKTRARLIAQTASTAALRPCPEESVNWNITKNIFIEGDNLEILKLLQKTYHKQVKMIYIDPPYNRGEDLIYPDKYNDSLDTYLRYTGQVDEAGFKLSANSETSGRFHTNWLNMMFPRLKLARNLLRDDGLLFVSIDDNEVANLRNLCNEVFGEENFVAQFIWNTEGHTDNQYDVKVNHEYICIYSKTSQSTLGHVVDPNTREESNLWKGFAENSITKNGSGNPPSEINLPPGFPAATNQLDLPASVPQNSFFEKVKDNGYITRQMTKDYEVTYPIRMDRMRAISGKLTESCRVFSGWANADKLRMFIEGGCKPIDEGNGNILTFYLSEKGVIYYNRKREKARNIVNAVSLSIFIKNAIKKQSVVL